MDYKKRDHIKSEIDVLINRVVTLQEQQKKYVDLTQSLKRLESEKDSKQRFYDLLLNKIDEHKSLLNDLNTKIIEQEWAIENNKNIIFSTKEEYKSINKSIWALEKRYKEYNNKIKIFHCRMFLF